MARVWADRLRVRPARIRIQKMRRKWASCSFRKCVCLSTDLLLEGRSFQEYTVLHELLHLRVPNHGKLFKSMLALYHPEWERYARQAQRRSDRAL